MVEAGPRGDGRDRAPGRVKSRRRLEPAVVVVIAAGAGCSSAPPPVELLALARQPRGGVGYRGWCPGRDQGPRYIEAGAVEAGLGNGLGVYVRVRVGPTLTSRRSLGPGPSPASAPTATAAPAAAAGSVTGLGRGAVVGPTVAVEAAFCAVVGGCGLPRLDSQSA